MTQLKPRRQRRAEARKNNEDFVPQYNTVVKFDDKGTQVLAGEVKRVYHENATKEDSQ